MTRKAIAPPKEELESKYSQFGVSISKLAKMYGVTNPTMRKWLVYYDIDRKSQQVASKEASNLHRVITKPTKEELLEFYTDNTFIQTLKKYKVSQETLYEWLSSYNITPRTLSEACKAGKEKQFADIQYSKEYLLEFYDESKPVECLAESLNVSVSHIKKLFRLYDIKVNPKYRSKAEIELYEYCVSLTPSDDWQHSDRSILKTHELDIVNHTKKLAIEYCGLYWHSEQAGKDSSYHQNKFIKCKEAGYKLLTIFETDDENKVHSLLKTCLNLNTRLYARNCVSKQISKTIANEFNKNHHLSSSVGATIHYGLYHEEELVMVLSMGKSRFNKSYEYECTRMTSHSEFTVVGGASKLFSAFIKDHDPSSIITYADLRFGTGEVYRKCGFKENKITPPNYWYFNTSYDRLYSRVAFQKHKLSKMLSIYDSSKTEYQNMLDNKWDRIWDCGNGSYVWVRSL